MQVSTFTARVLISISFAAGAAFSGANVHAQTLPSAEKAVASENALVLKNRLSELRKANALRAKDFCPSHPEVEECAKINARAVKRLNSAIAKEEAKAAGLKG